MGYRLKALIMQHQTDDETLQRLAGTPLGSTSQAFLIATGQEDPDQ